MGKFNEIFDDAIMNAAGLKNLVGNKEPKPDPKPVTIDELEDIPDDEKMVSAPAEADSTAKAPDPAQPESAAESTTEPAASAEVRDPAWVASVIKGFFLDELRKDRELRAEVREILDKYPDNDFVWAYFGKEGTPQEGKIYIGEKAADAAIPKAAKAYVKMEDIFTKELRVKYDGDKTRPATKDEYNVFMATFNVKKPAKDQKSGTRA